MKKILVFTLAVSLLVPALSSARKVKYKVVEVKNGGTVRGKVKTTEKVKDPIIPIIIKPKKTRFSEWTLNLYLQLGWFCGCVVNIGD